MKEQSNKRMDEFFQSKFNNREFEFKDAYWAEMTDLIEADEKSDKVGFPIWKWILSSVLFLIIGVSVWSYVPSYFNERIAQQTSTESAINVANVTVSVSEQNAITQPNENNENEITTSIDASENTLNEGGAGLESIQMESKMYDLKLNSQNHTGISNENASSSNDINPVYKGNENGLKSPVQKDNATKQSKVLTPFRQVLPDFEKQPLNPQLPIPLKIEEEKEESPDIFASSKRKLAPFALEALNMGEDEYDFGILKKYPSNVKTPKWTVGVMAGTNTAQDFRVSSGFSTDYIAGITANHNLNKNWSLNTGISYFSRSGLNTAFEVDSVVYSFGVESNITQVDIESLHYLEIPLTVGYKFGKKQKHQLITGVSYTYLINALSQVARESFNSTSNQADLAVSRTWGYQNNFQTHDLTVTLGYNYEVLDGLRFGVSSNYGLRSITPTNNLLVDNGNFQINQLDGSNNFFIRATLTYDLFKF